jgi:hypothetical protein
MDYKRNIQKGNKEDVLSSIIELPIKNLETRVRELEEELQQRRELSKKIQKRLDRERMGLEMELPPQTYSLKDIIQPRRTAIERELVSIERDIIREDVSCFRDLMSIRQELRKAKEQLVKERQKRELLK